VVILAKAYSKGGGLCNFLKLVSLLDKIIFDVHILYYIVMKLMVKIESGPKKITSDRQNIKSKIKGLVDEMQSRFIKKIDQLCRILTPLLKWLTEEADNGSQI
jgi:hypothetical protein